MGAVKKIVLTVNFTSGHTGSRTFSLKEGQGIIIGRLTNTTELVPPNALKFASKVISRKHAQIFVIEDKICIRDTKSSSGTFVNGQRLSAQGEESDFIELCTQDQIVIGEDCFVDGVEYKAVAMDITIDREIVPDKGNSTQIRTSVSAEEPAQSSHPGVATVKSKADVMGTPKASNFPAELNDEEETTTMFPSRGEAQKNQGKNGKSEKEKEKPLFKSDSVNSLRQVFDVPGSEAKSKGSNSHLDQTGKRTKDGKVLTKHSSKEELGKQKSKEDLAKSELEKAEKEAAEKQELQKKELAASTEKIIVPISINLTNLVRELTAISEDNVAPIKTLQAKESVLSEIRNSQLKGIPKDGGSQFSFSELPETLPGEFQSDLDIETEAIWSGILDGLDGNFMRYLFLTLPLSKAAKDKGFFGDPEKQDIKRKSYSLAKAFSKGNMTGAKRESSLGSLVSPTPPAGGKLLSPSTLRE